LENLTLPKNDNAKECLGRLDNQPTKFYKLNLPGILQKENTPILKAYKTNCELCEEKLTRPIETKVDRSASRKP